MPVSQYPAIAGLAIDFMQMMLLPVGVAVDQTRVVIGSKQVGNRCRTHIHNLHSFGLLLLFAHFAQLLDLRLALRQRLGEKLLRHAGWRTCWRKAWYSVSSVHSASPCVSRVGVP